MIARLLPVVLVAASSVSGLREAVPPTRAIGAVSARISPDGSSVAFSYQGAIWRLDGGVMRRLTAGPGFDMEPAWSPDGKRIAYVEINSGELRLIDAREGRPIPLENKVVGGGRVFFHSDGNRVLMNVRGPRGLSWVDLPAGTVTPAFDPPRRAGVFAPGPEVVVARHRDTPGEQTGNDGPQAELWVGDRRLAGVRSRVFDMDRSGDTIVFATDVGGAHNDLWSISVKDPSHAHKLTSGQADEDSPSLTADGRRLAYLDNREGATAIVVRDLETGDERTLAVTRLDFATPTGTVELDLASPMRVSLQEQGGKCHAPPGALYRVAGGSEHFYAEGKVRFEVPAGRYTLRAWRGLEYGVFTGELEVPAGGVVSAAPAPERWTDPPSRGWYGGESHIHANYGYGSWYVTPEALRLQIAAEGLHVANLVVANSDGDGVFDREFFRGGPDPVSTERHVLTFNEEFRATLWGHLTFYNLRHLVEPFFTGFKDTTHPYDAPTNADVADHVHAQGGHVNYTHPAGNLADPYLSAYSGKSMPVDVALGKIDSIDINWSYEPTLTLWYRLLNCGFRVPASAGTDCFLNRLHGRLPGSDRAYVRLEGPLSHGAWVAGLKAGRSFVTNGPMLEFEAGGVGIGGTLKLNESAEVAVKASATAAIPLDRVELVHNGKVVATGKDRLDGPIKIERSGWLSFRAFGSGQTQAHTSPIYVEVAGKPAGSREDADYFLAWIDRLEAQLKARDRLPTEEIKARVAAQLEAARAVYRR